MASRPAWNRPGFFLLNEVEFLPASKTIRIYYENHEVGEAPAHVLWNGRPGKPDWARMRVDPETRGALLVPTLAGGAEAEIPSDVLRAATDVDYRANVALRAAMWAKRVGQKIARLRRARGLSQRRLAQTVGLDAKVLSAIEKGRQECSLSMSMKLIEAMGAGVPDWLKIASEP